MTTANPPHPALRESEGELLPCPFCGGEAEIERHGDGRQSTIYTCTDCGCTLETGEEFNHGTAWNRRSEAQARAAEGGCLASRDLSPATGALGWRTIAQRFRIGDPVEVSCTFEHHADWQAIDLWISGVDLKRDGVTLDYTVSEEWPPNPKSGRTDGWGEADLSPRSALVAEEPAEREGSRDTQEQLSLLSAQLASTVKALERAQRAIGDWVCTYADDMVGDDALKAARGRIHEAGGTLAYTADISEDIAVLLSSLRGSGE